MLKKLFNKFITGSRCYLALKARLEELEKENEEMKKTFEIECLIDQKTKKRTYRSIVLCTVAKELESIISENKTTARKIIRQLNANFDKKNTSIKKIKSLCNEIIKGE